MSSISSSEEVGVGDTVSFTEGIKGNAIHVINGIGEALIMDFPIGTVGVVQTIDTKNRVVVRIPTQRANGYDLIGVSKWQYSILEKNNRRETEKDYE